MYNISCDKKYSLNLKIDNFKERFLKLMGSNLKNVVYLKDVFDNSTFRYRTYNVMQAMEKSNRYHINCFLIEEIDLLMPVLDKIDLVILQRCKWSFELENFIHLLRNKNIKICYDMDDLIYHPKYITKYLLNIGSYDEINMDVHFALASRYYNVASLCDSFLVTTEALKGNIEKDFDKKALIYPNFLNKEQEKISEEIIAVKDKLRDKEKFYIGYFSGSNSHVRDLETIMNPLLQLMDKYDNIYLYVVGYMDLPDELLKLKKEGRVIFHPFVSYQELEYLIASVDINVIPLQKNKFNECKSELKYFEASIVNTITVACNNSVYSSIIENGKNGFLANQYDWYSILENIYLNYDNMGDIIKRARVSCISKYGVYNQLSGLEKVFDKLIEM